MAIFISGPAEGWATRSKILAKTLKLRRIPAERGSVIEERAPQAGRLIGRFEGARRRLASGDERSQTRDFARFCCGKNHELRRSIRRTSAQHPPFHARNVNSPAFTTTRRRMLANPLFSVSCENQPQNPRYRILNVSTMIANFQASLHTHPPAREDPRAWAARKHSTPSSGRCLP